MSEVERRVDVTADLERFEVLLLTQLAEAGLPTNDVLVDVSERGRMLVNVQGR